MKITRTIEVEGNDFCVGDVIAFTLTDGEPVEAMAVEQRDNGMLFILVDCLKDEEKWNTKNTTEGGYAASKIRKTLNTKILKRFPAEIRERMLPMEDGDLLSLPYARELFGDETYLSATDPEEVKQWPCMKERRNRIAWRGSGTGEFEWYWLRSVSSAASACIFNSTGTTYTYLTSTANGVRPRFLLRKS